MIKKYLFKSFKYLSYKNKIFQIKIKFKNVYSDMLKSQIITMKT